jgi:probable H4MPT-linked C1 transfer pathway protein
MSIVGIDIGGANLKVAREDGSAWSEAFALWQSPQLLASRLMEQWRDDEPATVVATMTGELCDCFASRAEGVRRIIEHLAAAAEDAEIWCWSMQGCFVPARAARATPMDVAAGNWHALASWLAPMWSQGLTLLMDVGSTSSDIIPLRDGAVATDSRSDPERLARGELVYLGASRTPIMAIVDALMLDGARYPVMAEWFADMGDALVLSGDAAEHSDDMDTCDGRPRTSDDSARRMLRMIGSDLDRHGVDEARPLATQCVDAAVQRIAQAASQVLAGDVPDRVVISGSGAPLAKKVLDALAFETRVVDLVGRVGEPASHAGCAYALVQLWQRRV